MRIGFTVLAALCTAIAGGSFAHAQTGPVIVVPGKAGVPVMINGVVADGAVVYGDWGLARGNQGEIVIEGPVGYATNYDERGYFPATGRRPRVGRLEVEPAARARRSTDFYREWGAASDHSVPAMTYPPYDPPPVILAPRRYR